MTLSSVWACRQCQEFNLKSCSSTQFFCFMRQQLECNDFSPPGSIILKRWHFFLFKINAWASADYQLFFVHVWPASRQRLSIIGKEMMIGQAVKVRTVVRKQSLRVENNKINELFWTQSKCERSLLLWEIKRMPRFSEKRPKNGTPVCIILCTPNLD